MKNYLKLRLNKINLLFSLIFLQINLAAAQDYDSEYFFPIRPGQVNYLSGTMGEVRSSHFHAGIDVKTGGVEGLPIYATADGYVSRIKVSTSGYGNVLYVAHPNGATSVYAHMLKFDEPIASYVREAQYRNQNFDIELFPEINELKVYRGKPIGLSGNSGSSGGPHLHFEIRDANQWALNPLGFGFDEVNDNIAPLVYKLSLIPLNKNSRINGEFRRFDFNLYRKGNQYYLNEPIEVWGEIGVQVLTYDMLNGASNLNGVPYIDLEMDGERWYTKFIDKFSFYESRDILVHYDYPYSQTKGRRFEKLYIDDGNSLSIYDETRNKGKLIINQQKIYPVEVTLKDAYQNTTNINFELKGENSAEKLTSSRDQFNGTGYKVLDNILMIHSPVDHPVDIYANRQKYTPGVDYTHNQHHVYLWDLNRGLPDSVLVNNESINFNYQITIPAGASFNYYHELMDVHMNKQTLFDTLFLSLSYNDKGENKEYFTINDGTIPVRKYFNLTLKPKHSYSDKSKYAVYEVNGSRYSYEGGQWIGNKIRFRTRDLGTYTILKDDNPPKISPRTINSNTLSFYISDDLSGISSFEARVDGEWVLMNYDYKRAYIWSEKLDESKPFKGQVVLKVIDNAGNVQQYKTTL